MKENRGYEIRVASHIALVMAVTLFSLILIVLDLYRGWDRWTIPLFIAMMIICPAIHIFGVMEERRRLYIYSIFLFFDLFFYTMHVASLYDVVPVLMFAFALIAMTQETRLVIICMAVGFTGMVFRAVSDYEAIGKSISSEDMIKLAWNSLLVFATGLAVARMLKISEEARRFNREYIKSLEQETKRADVFLANVSNEIKTPVDEIIGLAEGAIDARKDGSIEDKLESISSEGRKVAHKIGDMLDYSELEMGKNVVNERDYTISSILDDLVADLKIYKETATELVIDVDPNLPAVLSSDPDKLEKILFHIIFNALKYTKKGGVYVRISYITQEYGINLNIDITDTGIGMEEEEIERIYDRFYRSEAGKAADQGGLGLGMSIVEGFVNELEGFVTLKSIPGEGTRVHVCIPQKVVDPSKCMSLENADRLQVGLYLQFDRFPDPHVREFYNEMMRNMAEGLELSVHRVDNENDLETLVEKHELTHLFVGELQYSSDPGFMEELAKKLKLVIVCDSDFKIEGPTEAILLNKPFYCFPTMSILQDEPAVAAGDTKAGDTKAEDTTTPDTTAADTKASDTKAESIIAADDKASDTKAEKITAEDDNGGRANEAKADENGAFVILERAGVDSSKGMDWCLNDIEVYTAVLLEFAGDGKEKQKELDEFYSEGDWENFMIRVHAVKSSAKTIGAQALSDSAKKLEKASGDRDEDYIVREYPGFVKIYRSTLAAINEAYGTEDDKTGNAIEDHEGLKGASE